MPPILQQNKLSTARTQFTSRMIINIVKQNIVSLINNSRFRCTTLLQCTTKLCVYSKKQHASLQILSLKAEIDSPFGWKIPHLLTEVKSLALHNMSQTAISLSFARKPVRKVNVTARVTYEQVLKEFSLVSRHPRYLRLAASHITFARSCCFESFLPLVFPADFREKERLLTVYIRIRFGPCLASYFRKRGIGKKRKNSIKCRIKQPAKTAVLLRSRPAGYGLNKRTTSRDIALCSANRRPMLHLDIDNQNHIGEQINSLTAYDVLLDKSNATLTSSACYKFDTVTVLYCAKLLARS